MDGMTLNAFADELGDIRGWDGLQKEALLKQLFGLAKTEAPVAKKLVPAFKGHTQAIEKAVGKRLAVDPRGIEQASHWNPMTQSIHRQHAVTGVEGWT